MSAERLREAARLMRERVTGAALNHLGDPSGRWQTAEGEGHNRDSRRTLGQFSMIHDGKAEVALVRGFSNERQAIAEHVASWHPVVALAVADWLEESADHLDAHDDAPGFPVDAVCPTALEGLECSVLGQALKVADAHLGSAA